jgi:hypothetical protein
VPLRTSKVAPAPSSFGDAVPQDLCEFLPEKLDEPSREKSGPSTDPQMPQTGTNWRSRRNRVGPSRLTATQLGFNVEGQAAEASAVAQEALSLGDVKLIGWFLELLVKVFWSTQRTSTPAHPFQSSMESRFSPHQMVCGLPGI